MLRREDLRLDDGLDAVDDVVGVDFARDDFLADGVDFWGYVFVGHGFE